MALQYEFPWNDLMKPVSQGEVIIALEKLNAQKGNLTIQQQKELYFYLQAFSKFNHLNNIDTNYKKNNLLSFINKWTEIGYEENKNNMVNLIKNNKDYFINNGRDIESLLHYAKLVLCNDTDPIFNKETNKYSLSINNIKTAFDEFKSDRKIKTNEPPLHMYM
jgi:hypothetical protein